MRERSIQELRFQEEIRALEELFGIVNTILKPPIQRQLSLLNKFLELFIVRSDCYALQRLDGSYVKLDSGISIDVLLRHLIGLESISVYPLLQSGSDTVARYICFDLDIPDLDVLRQMGVTLESHGIPRSAMLFEFTGRAYHLWVMFSQLYPSRTLYWIGRFFLDIFSEIFRDRAQDRDPVELFPTHPDLNSVNYSKPIRLPLGINRKTNRRSMFVDPGHPDYNFDLNSQLEFIARLKPISPSEIKVSAPLAEWLDRHLFAPSKPLKPKKLSDLDTQEDLEEILRLLRDRVAGKTGSWIRIHCPIHRPDRHPSMAISLKSLRVIDFHDNNSYRLKEFLEILKKVGYGSD